MSENVRCREDFEDARRDGDERKEELSMFIITGGGKRAIKLKCWE